MRKQLFAGDLIRLRKGIYKGHTAYIRKLIKHHKVEIYLVEFKVIKIVDKHHVSTY